MLPEFVNAIITLNTTGSYELYSGKTPAGGQTTVTIECKNAEGYNSQYFKIKQFVAEPNSQAFVQHFDVPSLEIVHKLILMSIEEGYHDKSRRSYTAINEGAGELKTNNQYDNNDSTIPVVKAQSRPTNKILSIESSTTETNNQSSNGGAFAGSEYPGGIDEDLESFMGGGIKIANMRVNSATNGQAASKHRSSIEEQLNGLL